MFILKSVDTMSMGAVTWDMGASPIRVAPHDDTPTARTRPHGACAAPAVDVSRLHTGSVIETASGKPPWMPLGVYDEGSKTVIRFKEALSYTNAPAVVVRQADGTPGVD